MIVRDTLLGNVGFIVHFNAFEASYPEMEGGDEVSRLRDDVLELASRQLAVVVNVSLEEDLERQETER